MFLDGLEESLDGLVLLVVEALDAVILNFLLAEAGQETGLVVLQTGRLRRDGRGVGLSCLGKGAIALPRHVGLDPLELVGSLVGMRKSVGIALGRQTRKFAVGLLVLDIIFMLSDVAGVGCSFKAILLLTFGLDGGGASIAAVVDGPNGGHWGVLVAGARGMRVIGRVVVEMEKVRVVGYAVG